MEKIQEILFENKEKIPDGVYLELMNSLNINADKYYKIEYMVMTPRVFWCNDDCDMNIRMNGNPIIHEIIVSCDNPNIYEHNRKTLEAGKPFLTEMNIFPPIKTNITVRHNTLINDCKHEDRDEDDDENIDGHDLRTIHINTNFELVSSFLILSVKKC